MSLYPFILEGVRRSAKTVEQRYGLAYFTVYYVTFELEIPIYKLMGAIYYETTISEFISNFTLILNIS